MIKILIIEDEPGVQITLEDRLTSEGYQVVVREDGIQGEEEAAKDFYDLILLDIMLPGRDGFAVCRNLRDRNILTPILMLTARNTDLDTIIGLRQGADDYLAKPFDMGVLLARIEALLRRSSLNEKGKDSSCQGIFNFGQFTLNTIRGSLMAGSREISLHTKEFRLLEFFLTNPDELLSRDRILDEVWGYGSETTTRTVDVHIAKLRQKLNESEKPVHIQTIRGRGYRFQR